MWVSKGIIEQYKKDLDKAKRDANYWQRMALHYSEIIAKKEAKIVSLQNLVKEQLKYIEPPLKEFEAKVFYSEDSFALCIKDVKSTREALKRTEEILSSLNIRGWKIQLQEIKKEK